MVAVNNLGILIRGRSGIGKTMTAINLLREGHRLIADDVVELFKSDTGTIMAKSPESNPRLEIRGLGIFDAKTLFPGLIEESWHLELIVDLDTFCPETDLGKIEPSMTVVQILGCDLPCIRLGLADTMDPAILIELVIRYLRNTGTL